MLQSLILGFIAGASVPIIARRFGKFIPTDPGETICRLIHRPHFPKSRSKKRGQRFHQLWKKLVLCAGLWGCGGAVLFGALTLTFPTGQVPWLQAFVYILALLAAIDKRFYLLPDVLTVPLLILGFSWSVFTNAITPQESIYGALYGYLIPTLAVLATYHFIQDGFGGGDVKLLAALGAWFGLYDTTLLLIVSVILFGFCALIRRKKSDAYGPYLAASALIILFTRHY
ncbi:MAG: prepilin peptidase [Alphaproteobacteria bacterium]|nr:prepilin peptidase [Alphaproteobacteria bacterium]